MFFKEISDKILKVFYSVFNELEFILNFGKEPKFKRMIFENKFKSHI